MVAPGLSLQFLLGQRGTLINSLTSLKSVHYLTSTRSAARNATKRSGVLLFVLGSANQSQLLLHQHSELLLPLRLSSASTYNDGDGGRPKSLCLYLLDCTI